ncbi:MAG: hypothetical protein M0T70_02475 [Geobacteraceae bacterium]|nr:hypothetical protein [Geobacteraceae bacterium]
MISVEGNVLRVLKEFPVSKSLTELLPDFEGQLPEGARFDDDVWDILSWKNRKGNARYKNLDFTGINSDDLKVLAKTFVLHSRLTKRIGAEAAYNYILTIKYLDKCVLGKSAQKLVSQDFYRTETYIAETSGAPHKSCNFLFVFGEWLNAKIGLPVSYTPGIVEVYKHGRRASEEGRQKKLINTLIIRDMIEANARTDLLPKDKFYLAVFTIFVATGFRINELATLPKNCLEERDGTYSLRYVAEKVRRLEARFIPLDMVPAVQSAIEHIIEITEPGREAVQALKENPGLDWVGILSDPVATEYFVKKYCHEWTSQPQNLMINPDGVWLEKERRIIDIISEVEKAGSKSAAARALGIDRATVDGLLVAQHNARQGLLPRKIASRGRDLRTDWDTDGRVVSYMKFMKHCNILLPPEYRDKFRQYVDEAQAMQLEGKIYPAPAPQPMLEEKYRRRIRPVIEDFDGNSLLEPEDALFIIPRYAFSDARPTMDEDYRLITDKAVSRWFSGEGRSHGTKNQEDSCFSRLGIFDPETNEPAKFTSHDIRHWLNTTYAEGHMSEQTISLIFSRKAGSNHTYDQTSKYKRLENIRQAIRDGESFGHVAENYHRLATFSRDDAEQYLLAATRMVSIMPHGNCSLSWGMEACPHHLSCFSGCGDGCCEHFSIDMSNEEQISEVRRIEREAELTMEFMGEGIQFEHFSRIKRNIEMLLANG